METLLHVQGNLKSTLKPLFLVHAISGLALPYFGLSNISDDSDDQISNSRPVYGISSPIYQYKSYQLPHSLDELAREYVALIQRQVQPEGPYLLGGWSMGGMIAIKMAAILESRGEEVQHVLLIDSANPETLPAFIDPKEHELITSLTYNAVAKRMNLPTLPDGGNGESNSSSEDEEESEDDEVGIHELMPRMKKHIFNGLSMIGGAHPENFLPEPLHTSATLIKCSSLARLPPVVSDARKSAVRKNFYDEHSGWKLPNLQTVYFEAQHDSAFDRTHVGDLTVIMRNVLLNAENRGVR